MRSIHRLAFTFFAIAGLTGTAIAEQPAAPEGTPQPPAAPTMPQPPATPTMPPQSPDGQLDANPEAAAHAEIDKAKPKKPQRGDFDAGGKVRLPSGPDDMGQFATFNWIALDLGGNYLLLDFVKVTGRIPLAVKKPDMVDGVDPKMIGGMSMSLEVKLPKSPFQPKRYDTKAELLLEGAYMREGAMLLSDKDFPLFTGKFQPGLRTGVRARVKLSSLVDFSTEPVFVYQSGSAESLTAVQVPTSTILKLGSLLKLSADFGIFTGDDYSLRGSNGGRISGGGAITVKIGKIIAHAGAGFASLLTGGLYPTIRDSFYVDLNVKFAK